MTIPDWLAQARAAWRYDGRKRPPFAETPGPGQESIWDYPRPPMIKPDPRRVRIEHGGVLIAATDHAVRVLETGSPPTFYLPRSAIAVDVTASDPGAGSFCEWKGRATYWTVLGVERVAWSYEAPLAGFESIAGHLSFYCSTFACSVGGVAARPQAGGFYGGWITPEIVGPFKGERGTGGW